MDDPYNISGPSDWLKTPLRTFSDLENALRCQVCKDFYITPMITSCSHTFCSICIRRCLSGDGKCPACRTTDQASKLRRNWAIEEVVAAFQAARPAALEVVRGAGQESTRPNKRRRVEQEAPAPARTTRSSSRRIALPETAPIEIDSDEDDSEEPSSDVAAPLPEDGLVACPSCNRRMKEESVFAHLDHCDGSRTPPHPTPTPRAASAKPPPNLLPELNYSLLKENALRKKLQELGIPSTGPKPLLIRRHTEWVNIWNANADSSAPRSKRELLAELDKWDRSQGERAREGEGAGIMKKEFDGVAWGQSHGEEFARLVAEARRKAKTKGAIQGEKDEDKDGDEQEEKTNGYQDNEESVEQKSDAVNGEPEVRSVHMDDIVSNVPAKHELNNSGQHEEIARRSADREGVTEQETQGDLPVQSMEGRKLPMF